jgi:NADH-quinone oxidoreductase subunit L
VTFAAATLAISGIPPLAGFFSKDEILGAAWFGGHKIIWAALLGGAVITAFYMTRLIWLVFFGKYRGDEQTWGKAHESPITMTVPLIVLGVLSVIGGWIGIPLVMSLWFNLGDLNHLHHWLSPAIVRPEHAHSAVHASSTVSMLVTIAIVAATIGIVGALTIYRSEDLPRRLAKLTGPAYRTLRNLFWVDELYDAMVIRPFYALCRIFNAFDRWVVDGLVNATGIVTELSGQVIKLFQTGLVRNYAMTFLLGVVAILFYLITR